MLEDRIYQDYVNALKAKDKQKADFLSFLRADLKNRAIDLKKDKLDDNEVLTALGKQKKRLVDSRENIEKSGREDLIQAWQKETAILDGYLPQQLEENQLVKIIQEIIAETNASSIKDMGKVMKEVLSRVSGKADSKKVSELVRSRLSSF